MIRLYTQYTLVGLDTGKTSFDSPVAYRVLTDYPTMAHALFITSPPVFVLKSALETGITADAMAYTAMNTLNLQGAVVGTIYLADICSPILGYRRFINTDICRISFFNTSALVNKTDFNNFLVNTGAIVSPLE